eukprot:CAMPEP_0176174888 /NCGR_PEP_ID=MMETSP0120_2-20121206/89597_1 /TAXON_ID=160619 /ORGANISM="Kryptoperidinium foliaceum, Strain CCMP 1326" /LENGTH=846 /DNA_ID=CAMNT_0017512927 /DNA_START=137 /DNA_END=2674 /DNA_ORIENTATION=+
MAALLTGSANLPQMKQKVWKCVPDLDRNLLWFLGVCSVATVALRAFDNYVAFALQGEAHDAGVAEWCALSAFAIGAMVMSQRQPKRLAQKLKHDQRVVTDPSPRERTPSRPLRRNRRGGSSSAGGSPLATRLPELDNLLPSSEPAGSQVQYLDESAVAAILRACRSGDASRAGTTVHEMLVRGMRSEAEAGMEASSAMHQIVDGACCKDAELALEWLLTALDAGVPIAARTLHLLMDAFAANSVGRCRRAEEALVAAVGKGAAPDANCFYCLFERCLPMSDAAGVEEWLRRPGLDMTMVFVGLIRSHNQTATPQEAEAWLRRATEAGVARLTHVYNAAIQVCLKANDLKRGMELFETLCDQTSRGATQPCATPDVVSYSLVMEANAQNRKDREVDRVFHQMMARGDCSKGVCYGTVIKAYARIGSVQVATEWLEEARAHEVHLDAACYSALVAAFAKLGMPEKADRLVQQMLREGPRPDAACYLAVINGYAKSQGSDTKAAPRIVRLMCEQNVEPNVAALGAALHACARAGSKGEAESLFKMVVSRGTVVPDSVCYNALINAAVKAGDIKAAERWVDSMFAARVTPNVVTYTTLLHAYARDGDIEAAERGMEMMRSNRIIPNAVSYSALMQACVKKGDIDRAEKWFHRMRAAGVQANAVCYSSILDGCAKIGDWLRAERWLAAMDEDGVTPTVVCFNNVINACAKGSNAARADAWLRKLLRDESPTAVGIPKIRVPAEVTATRQSFTSAAQAYASTGSVADVERIFADSSRLGMGLDQFSLTVLLSAYSRARPRQVEQAEKVFTDYITRGGKVTPPSLHVLQSCLGLRQFDRLMSQLGMGKVRGQW